MKTKKDKIYPDLCDYDDKTNVENTHQLYPNLNSYDFDNEIRNEDNANTYSVELFLFFILSVLIAFIIGFFFFHRCSTLESKDYNKNFIKWKESQTTLNKHSWKVINVTLYKHLHLNQLPVSPIINAIGHPDNIRKFSNELSKFLSRTVGISRCHVIERNSEHIKDGITLQNFLSGIVGYNPRNSEYLKTFKKHQIAGCVLIEEPGELPEDTLKTLHALVDDDRSLFPDLMIVLGLGSYSDEVLDESISNNEYLKLHKRADLYYRRHINEKKSVFNAGDALIARIVVNVIEV